MKQKLSQEQIEQIYQTNLERLDAYIKAHHAMRITEERSTVLRRICELGNPFTVEMVIKATEKDFISYATVYNSLRLFQKARMVHALGKQYRQSERDMEIETHAQFELADTGLSQLQLVCTRCGRVAEFKDARISGVLEAGKYNNFNMARYSVFLYGECKFCRSLIARDIKAEEKKKKK